MKMFVKRKRAQIRKLSAKTIFRFRIEDLTQAFAALGISGDDVVLAHSSYDRFDGFSGKPSDIIACLLNAVGTGGTLLMPTLTFDGTAVAYAQTDPVFDTARTPSRTGLLTELFRRSPGVIRSVHPTHPVALAGRLAEQLAANHHTARTPCGYPSPYHRLLDANGKIALIGCDIDVLTFFHTIEEHLEPRMPFSPFTQEVYRLQSRTVHGDLVETQTRLFDPLVSRRRNLGILKAELVRMGALQRKRLGRLRISVISANAALTAATNLADRGTFCYDPT